MKEITILEKDFKTLLANFYWAKGMCDELDIYQWEDANADLTEMEQEVDDIKAKYLS